MKLESVTAAKERVLCSLLIMSDEFSHKIIPILKPTVLKVEYSKFIAEWCLEYYKEFKSAPAMAIQSIFDTKRVLLRDDDTALSIATFLESLQKEYDPHKYQDIPFYIKDIEAYIRECDLEHFEDKFHTKRLLHKLDDCEALIANFKRSQIPQNVGVSIYENLDAFEEAFFEDKLESLFHLPKKMDEVFGPMYRGDLSAILATSKGKKSWTLNEVALAALEGGNNVLKINLEMREIEDYQRFWRGVEIVPMVSGQHIFPKFKPTVEGGSEYRVRNEMVYRDTADFSNKEEIIRKLKMRFNGADYRAVKMNSFTTTPQDIENLIINFRWYNEWEPSVVIIDYADLLNIPWEKDYRLKIGLIWQELRRIAQEQNIHICTVSQGNRGISDGEEPTVNNIAESVNKATHVSTFVGLWADEKSIEHNCSYMKNIICRYKIPNYNTVCIAHNLDLGRFYMDGVDKSALAW